MRRIALILIFCIAAKMACDAPFAFLMLLAFWIGSMNWIEQGGSGPKTTRP